MPVDPRTVTLIGLGKIGLPLAVQYARCGRRVIGCDINSLVVETINAGRSHINEEAVLAAEVPRLVHQGLLSATVNIAEAVRQSGVVVVIVPVVINEKHEVDFVGIEATTAAIGVGLQNGTLVIYETTLPVGTTAKRLAPILERTANLKAGRDFFLAYSPERVSSGSIFLDLTSYPKVVGGIDEKSTEAAVTFYKSVLEAEIITMDSADNAEFVKLIETTYRDVNIALANEFACFADARGLNALAAIAAANTQPYSHIHAPGVGVGGHCIPVYPHFLIAGLGNMQPSVNKTGMLKLARHARLINDAMAQYAVRRIEAVVGSLVDKSVLILGVAYRGNVREVAFSSAKLLQDALMDQGADVYVDDPLFSSHELPALGYKPLTPDIEGSICAIILQADHLAYQSLGFGRFTGCQVVLDGRNSLNREHIESLGMRYITIGDGNQNESESLKDVRVASTAFCRGGG